MILGKTKSQVMRLVTNLSNYYFKTAWLFFFLITLENLIKLVKLQILTSIQAVDV